MRILARWKVAVGKLGTCTSQDNRASITYKIAPRRAGDIATCYADTAKAKELLDWEATKSLEDMCRDSWKFTLTQLT